MAPAPAPELSVFISMAPALELCFLYYVSGSGAVFFILCLRLQLRIFDNMTLALAVLC